MLPLILAAVGGWLIVDSQKDKKESEKAESDGIMAKGGKLSAPCKVGDWFDNGWGDTIIINKVENGRIYYTFDKTGGTSDLSFYEVKTKINNRQWTKSVYTYRDNKGVLRKS